MDWIQWHEESTKNLCKLFYNTYFAEEDDYEDYRYDMIWEEDKYWFWPIDIHQWSYFFCINDAYIALKNEVPYDTLIERYDKSQEAHTKSETFTNLYNYNRYKIEPDVVDAEKRESIKNAKANLIASAKLFAKELWVDADKLLEWLNLW